MMKQCTTLTCKETFAFKTNGKGRTVTFKQGQRFWVTNSQTDQAARNVLNVAREGKSMNSGYDFTPEQINQFFTVSELRSPLSRENHHEQNLETR